jgi:hypothetical protein
MTPLSDLSCERRFMARKSVSTLEVAEHILQLTALGVHDLNGLKSSTIEKLSVTA